MPTKSSGSTLGSKSRCRWRARNRKPSLIVARPARRHRRRARWRSAASQQAAAAASDTGDRPGRAPAGSRRRGARTPRPITAAQKLTTKIASNSPGASVSSEKAISGPSIAPAVSSARWTPKAVASCSRVAGERDQRVARGVRMPLPVRSRKTIAPSAGHALRREQQPEARERREPVAQRRDLLVPARAVGDEAAGDAHERRGALLEPVDDPELERREAPACRRGRAAGSRDHLGRDVREEADEPEQDDVAGDASATRAPAQEIPPPPPPHPPPPPPPLFAGARSAIGVAVTTIPARLPALSCPIR